MTSPRPFARPKINNSEAAAIKALASGLARQDQQKIALDYIIDVLAGTYDLSFRPDELGGERDTSFAEGRRFVGLAVRRIILTPVDELVPPPKKEETNG